MDINKETDVFLSLALMIALNDTDK